MAESGVKTPRRSVAEGGCERPRRAIVRCAACGRCVVGLPDAAFDVVELERTVDALPKVVVANRHHRRRIAPIANCARAIG